MSGGLEKFEQLARVARGDSSPQADVADRVASRLSDIAAPAVVRDWPLWGVSGVSVAAAVLVLAVAIQQGNLFDDPLADWLRPLVVVMR